MQFDARCHPRQTRWPSPDDTFTGAAIRCKRAVHDCWNRAPVLHLRGRCGAAAAAGGRLDYCRRSSVSRSSSPLCNIFDNGIMEAALWMGRGAPAPAGDAAVHGLRGRHAAAVRRRPQGCLEGQGLRGVSGHRPRCPRPHRRRRCASALALASAFACFSPLTLGPMCSLAWNDA